MMLKVKQGGYSEKFMKHFAYSREFRNIRGAFNAYKNLSLPKNKKYREWFESEQAVEFPKLQTTMLANGVKKMIHVRFFDYPGIGWNNVWWNWQGIIKYEGTRLNPIIIKKPSYYAYSALSQKLYGFDSSDILPYGSDIFVYRFNFKHKGPVYIAWTESPSKTIDLSAFSKKSELKITHIVTKLDKTNQPIRRSDEVGSVRSIPVTRTPIFLE
jgi:hypothetical protein